MEFKGREQRAQCYKSRDIYFECIDKEEDKNKREFNCKKLLESFEGACGAKWTEHFIRKRDYLKFKEKLQTGGVEAFDKTKIQ